MAKYRNKKNGKVVDVLEIEQRIGMTSDIINFTKSPDIAFVVDPLPYYKIGFNDDQLIAPIGSYIVEENGFEVLHSCQFEPLYEKENDGGKYKMEINYYVNRFTGDIVSAFQNTRTFTNNEVFNLSQGLILGYTICGGSDNYIELKGGVKLPIRSNDYIIKDKLDIYTLPEKVFESGFTSVDEARKEKIAFTSNNIAETNSNIKGSGCVEGKMFNPINNAVVSLGSSKPTIRDYILDEIAYDKGEKLMKVLRERFKKDLDDSNKWLQVDPKNKEFREKYNKTLENLERLNSVDSFLRLSQEEVVSMFGDKNESLNFTLFNNDVHVEEVN